MRQIILKNGLFGGLIVSAVMAGMTLYMKANPNYEPNMIIGFGSMLLAFFFVYVGIKQHRYANNGNITFVNAFLTGVKISLIISSIYVIVWLIIYYNFFPNFIEQYSEMAIKNAKPEDLAKITAEMESYKEWYKSPLMIVLLTYMEILPLGIVTSLILGLIMKRNNSKE